MTNQKKTNKKKKPPVRKVSKPSVAHKKAVRKPANTMALVTIPYAQIQKPETYHGKYSVIPTPFNERQLLQMIAPTPQDIILSRKGKGGKDWDYIPGWWFKKKLNFAFGWMWDFDILDKRIDGDFITVTGKLTVKNAKGEVMICKTDFGGHPVTYLKDQKHTAENYLDISNDFKAAATDAMKRCAVQLGFGLDVYSKSEYKTENGSLQPSVPENFKHGDNIHVVEIKAQPSQTDYVAKLNKYLDEHPRGPFTVNEKIRFVAQQTKLQVDWSKMNQSQAQVILATLMRSDAGKK